MRIVYLHQYFNTPAESGSTRSYEFAKRLAARGHDVHIVTSERSETSASRGWHTSNIEGFHVHRIYVPYNNSMGVNARVRAFMKFATSAGALSRKLRPDLLFATSTPLTIILPARYAALWRKTPIVFEIRDSWPTVPIALGYLRSRWIIRLARRLERSAYRGATRLIALSPGMAADAVVHGADARLVTIIPNAADLSTFNVDPVEGELWRRAHDIDPTAPLVVYTGTFGAANDVTYLVELAAETRKLDPTLTIALIGTGGEEDKVRSKAAELGLLGTTIRLIPPVAKSLMPAVLSAATIATSVVIDNPAMNANSANKFFDALAAGRPIAINHEGWQAELIRNRQLGLVLQRDDIVEAARSLVEFTSNNSLTTAARVNARQVAQSQFDRDKLSDLLLRVLEDAFDEAKRAQ